jgi:hypothetical protein
LINYSGDITLWDIKHKKFIRKWTSNDLFDILNEKHTNSPYYNKSRSKSNSNIDSEGVDENLEEQDNNFIEIVNDIKWWNNDSIIVIWNSGKMVILGLNFDNDSQSNSYTENVRNMLGDCFEVFSPNWYVLFI